MEGEVCEHQLFEVLFFSCFDFIIWRGNEIVYSTEILVLKRIKTNQFQKRIF